MFRKGIRPGLYAITDTELMPGQRLFTEVAAALRGGAVMVQYRDKTSSAGERLRQAEGLQALCRDAGIPLIINDDPELAYRVGAAGVHLGQTDTALADARALLGKAAIIGATCHGSLTLAEEAVAASADYLAFGRFYLSGTKPGAPPADPEILARARTWELPVVAIGGITADNGGRLVEAGADCLAVIGALFGGDDTENRARQLSELVRRHHPGSG